MSVVLSLSFSSPRFHTVSLAVCPFFTREYQVEHKVASGSELVFFFFLFFCLPGPKILFDDEFVRDDYSGGYVRRSGV